MISLSTQRSGGAEPRSEETDEWLASRKVPAPRAGAHTVIGSSIVIDGEISGDEDLVIQGTVKGRISLRESLYVESSGVIEADIETANVEVSGQVTGQHHGLRQGGAQGGLQGRG